LQTSYGGGEAYTVFLIKALDSFGVRTKLIVDAKAKFWGKLSIPCSVQIHRSYDGQLESLIDEDDIWILGHTYIPDHIISKLKNKHLVTAMAHMPVQIQGVKGFLHHDMVFPVSKWVQKGLRESSIKCWDEPLYGIANINLSTEQKTICKNSLYDWDLRKGRDRFLSWLEPLVTPFFPEQQFSKRDGITLGIVSRITTIKQFPLLFDKIVPILIKYPSFNIEIFGSGGYASIRDLKKAIYPIKSRVRFWGYQNDVALIYKNIDYLLVGLPEKEALGLNIIEAQTSNVPVVAVNAMPFTETVVNEATGFLYADPRDDNGKDFERVLYSVLSNKKAVSVKKYRDNLRDFSFDAFVSRWKIIVNWVDGVINEDKRNFKRNKSV